MSRYPGLDLAPEHEQLLVASGISPEAAAARGYRTVTRKVELKGLGFSDKQCRTPALLIPIRNVCGELVTYQIRPNEPRVLDGKAIKYESPGGSRPAVDVPVAARPLLGDPSRPLVITEGARKVDAAVSRGICCIGVPGVWSWRGTNEQGGVTALADWEAIAFKARDGRPRDVLLAFDSDVTRKRAVRSALVRFSAFIELRGSRVRVVYLPEPEGGGKVGLDDFLAAGRGWPDVLALAEDAVRPLSPAADGAKALPEIWTQNGDLPALARQAWAALKQANDPPVLFRFGDMLSRVETGERGAILRPLDHDRMHYHVTRAAFWYATREEGDEEMRIAARPPGDLVRDMQAEPEPPLPRCVALTGVPVFAPDGRLIDRAGYDAESGLLFVPPKGFEIIPVPEHPSAADVALARSVLLDELLHDFPFVGDPERAHAVALLILPFLRAMIDGPTPLHLVEKPSPGTGAGLLAEVLAFPALGAPLPVMTEGHDEDEWRKRITAKLVDAPLFVLIDNVRSRLDSAALSGALTAPWWEDRVLGFSRNVRIPVRCAWMATANNPKLSDEMARRVARIRLDAGVEAPWLREPGSFRHPDLRGWVRAHRGDLVRAALVLGQAYVAAGRPAWKGPRIGAYESWSGVIGGTLDVAGITGFLGNLEDANADHNAEAETLRAFVSGWWSKYESRPMSAADLVGVAQAAGIDLGSDEASRANRLGNRLRQIRERRFGNLRVERGSVVRGTQQWRLVELRGGGGGRGGPPPEPPREAEDVCDQEESDDACGEDPGTGPPTTPTTPTTPTPNTAGADGATEEQWERWQERAAILEAEAGLPREEAERRAWAEIAAENGGAAR